MNPEIESSLINPEVSFMIISEIDYNIITMDSYDETVEKMINDDTEVCPRWAGFIDSRCISVSNFYTNQSLEELIAVKATFIEPVLLDVEEGRGQLESRDNFKRSKKHLRSWV